MFLSNHNYLFSQYKFAFLLSLVLTIKIKPLRDFLAKNKAKNVIKIAKQN